MKDKNKKGEFFQLRLSGADARRLAFLAIVEGKSKAAIVRSLVSEALTVQVPEEPREEITA